LTALHALIALVRNDLVLYFSNRRALLVSIAAPILIAAFFGALFDPGSSKRPLRIPVAVADQDASEISKKIVSGMKGDASFDIQELDEPAAVALVKQGKVRAALVLPKSFGDQAARALFRPASKPAITVYYDPSQAMTLAVVRGLLAQHVMESVSQAAFGGTLGGKLIDDARNEVNQSRELSDGEKRDLLSLFEHVQQLRQRAAGSSDVAAMRLEMPFEAREQEVTSGFDRKYNSYAHSFAGMGVQFILFMGIDLGVGVLLARRLGLWKRLRAAPLSRRTLLATRIVSGALIATILLLLIYAVAIAVFGVRIDGSIIGFLGVGIAFALLTASFGLLIAALGKSPEATRGLAIFVTIIMVMLGGAWVPSFIFPEWLQTVSLFVPTRWAVDGLDAMTWRGLSFDAALAPIGVMLAFSALFAGLAVIRFDWEE
jgi:ABC-2 type transport system permease protein